MQNRFFVSYRFIFTAVTVLVLFSYAPTARAASVIAEQTDESVSSTITSTCNNLCSNVIFGTQVFVPAVSATLGSLEVFTANFGTQSRFPDSNDCFLRIYNQETGAFVARSDNGFTGSSCAGGVIFDFASSTPQLAAGTHYRWEFIFGIQNFSSLTFFGSPNDIVGGVFNIPPVVNAKFLAVDDRSNILPVEPVVVIPGVMGSQLNRVSDGVEVWPNATKMLFSGSDDYLNDLKLSASGGETTDISTGDILRQELLIFPFYSKLIKSLEDAGYSKSSTLFLAPYDWRFGIASSAQEISPVLAHAAAASPNGKINVIAHSMGGLLMKEYLKSATSSVPVDKLILAGVPQLGAPKVFKLLNYGDDLGLNFFGIGANQDKTKEISQNMPGVYDLLPGRRYIDVNGGYVRDFRGGGAAILDYDATNALMTGDPTDKRNAGLLSWADTFRTALDGEQFQIGSSSIYSVIGCRNNTLGEIMVYDGGKYSVGSVNGDGTVPLTSALNLSSGYHKFFSTTDDHTGLIQGDASLKTIANILSSDPDQPVAGISRSLADCIPQSSSPQLFFAANSVAQLHIYDDQNRHTGLNSASGTVEANIPGSSYEMIKNNDFAIVPAGKNYRIVAQAVATGTLDLEAEVIDNFVPTGKVTYLSVPLPSAQARAELNVSATTMPTDGNVSLTVDINSDSIPDISYAPTAVLASSTSQDVDPPTLFMPSFPANPLLNSTTTFIFSATDASSGIASIAATLNGVTVAPGQVVILDRAGINTFRLEAKDNAGNPSMAETTFRVLLLGSTTFAPIADTYIKQDKSDKNQGSETKISVGDTGKNRGLIQFNTDSIRSFLGTSTILSARLQLPVTRNGNNWGAGGEVDLIRMFRGWTERGATWNCPDDTNTKNSATDCPNGRWNMTGPTFPFATTPSASTTITNKLKGLVNLDVTTDIRNFLAGVIDTGGWILKKANENSSGLAEFSSKESSSAPTLVIDYAR